jgi:hypothetical protein
MSRRSFSLNTKAFNRQSAKFSQKKREENATNIKASRSEDAPARLIF